MTMMTYVQVEALRDLMREHDAQTVAKRELPYRAVAVTLWTDSSDVPCCVAVIGEHGTVTTQASVAA